MALELEQHGHALSLIRVVIYDQYTLWDVRRLRGRIFRNSSS
jgi:hypothetical protein